MTKNKYLRYYIIIGSVTSLLFIFTSSVIANEVDKATWDKAVLKTKRNADICNEHVQSVEMNHSHYAALSQCNKVCRQVAMAMGKPNMAPNNNLLTYANQCDALFNKLPAEYQVSTGNASKEKSATPTSNETTEDIIIDIERIAKECEEIAEQFTDPRLKNKSLACQQNCLATKRKIQEGRISTSQASAWRDICKSEMKQASTPARSN